ncbi:MAG: 4Fe-4S dicluster domain-containing protein [Candidatus Heimdallarchaeota archaeon]|nr:4Fe-4S dicluster domain-containing protein [Candidatus Heimdallarchaeota archaeon]
MEVINFDIKNKIGVTSWETDSHENAHIVVNGNICKNCPHHLCIAGCPTECFKFYENEMVFQYEDCVECGTCDIMCDQGAVSWNNPRGTYGVKYSQG